MTSLPSTPGTHDPVEPNLRSGRPEQNDAMAALARALPLDDDRATPRASEYDPVFPDAEARVARERTATLVGDANSADCAAEFANHLVAKLELDLPQGPPEAAPSRSLFGLNWPRLWSMARKVIVWAILLGILGSAITAATYIFEPEIRAMIRSPRGKNLAGALGISPNWRINCSIAVQSRPAGAKVLLDGEYQGTTPMVAELNLGDARALNVRVQMSGFQAWESRVDCSNYASVSVPLARE